MKNLKKNEKLNLDNYPGIYPKELIPQFIKSISNMFMALPDGSKEKDAIIKYLDLLGFYYSIADKDSPMIKYALSFCENLKSNILNFVKNQYPEYDIDITVKGRIKSPISASNKFRSEISQAMKSETDLDSIEIHDLFAFRIVVTVKDKIGNILDDNIAIPITYAVVEQALEYSKNYENIQLKKSKSRSDKNAPIVHDNVTVPNQRTDYIDEHEANGDFKDYIKYPKRDTNYQSVHSKLEMTLPETKKKLLFEMQIRTYNMNEHAERGPASHLVYKSRKLISFSRVPQLFEENNDGHLEFITMDQAFKEFYNISLTDINPSLTVDFLEQFLKETNYAFSLGLLNIDHIDENGKLQFSSAEETLLPVELMGPPSKENLAATATYMFEKSKDSDLEIEEIN